MGEKRIDGTSQNKGHIPEVIKGKKKKEKGENSKQPKSTIPTRSQTVFC